VALAEHLTRATCRDGDEIVFAWRSFEAYPIIAATAGTTGVRVPNDAGHGHDLARWPRRCRPTR
jgi:histidinol-phosphate aminotransferase